jgi:hypothetical protein
MSRGDRGAFRDKEAISTVVYRCLRKRNSRGRVTEGEEARGDSLLGRARRERLVYKAEISEASLRRFSGSIAIRTVFAGIDRYIQILFLGGRSISYY